ncbi:MULTISPECIES: hypothetical protein [unclassified Microcoleus]|uniref:hypothetical protein n=1 Tax=unclassified Microcoleus TaxID=2642155 RepID=UPI002FD3CA66
MGKQKLFEVNNYTVWQFSGHNAFFFKSGIALDAYGVPNAYNLDDTGEEGGGIEQAKNMFDEL